MKRLLQILFLVGAAVFIGGVLLVGAWWLRTVIPGGRVEEGAEVAAPEPAPAVQAIALATIPWKRPASPLAQVTLSPVWTPEQKMPPGAKMVAIAVPPPADLPHAKPGAGEDAEIAKGLTSSDPAIFAAAVEHIERRIAADPAEATAHLRGGGAVWARALLERGHSDVVDKLTAELLLPMAWDTQAENGLLSARIRSALAAKQPDAAIARARRLFLFSPLFLTNPSLNLMEQAITLKSGKDSEALRSFRSSLKGTTATTTSAPATGPATMPAFSIRTFPAEGDEDRFATAAKAILKEDYSSLTQRGNLLLLADEPTQAEHAFRRAYTVAPDNQIPAAIENLARCVKCETGNIEAVNAYVQRVAAGEEK